MKRGALFAILIVVLLSFIYVSAKEDRFEITTTSREFSTSSEDEKKMERMMKEKFESKEMTSEEKKMYELMKKEKSMGSKGFVMQSGVSISRAEYVQTYPTQGMYYHGANKEEMIFGRLFTHIADKFEPDEFDYEEKCKNPEAFIEEVLNLLKSSVGDFSIVCKDAEEQSAKCREHGEKGCRQLGGINLESVRGEDEKLDILANACPVDKEAIIKRCVHRSKEYMKDRLEFVEDICKEQWDYQEIYNKEQCERQREQSKCDKGDFIEECLKRYGIGKEEEKKEQPAPQPAPYPCPPVRCDLNVCKNGCVIDANGCMTTTCKEPLHQEILCPTDYKPVCGTDGKTYSNDCHAKKAGVGIAYYSECKAPCPEIAKPQCSADQHLNTINDERGCVIKYECVTVTPPQDVCPTESKPLCGSDGKTYQNDCYARKAGINVAYAGECKAPCPEVQKPQCSADQKLNTVTDDKGCVIKYECVSTQPTQPTEEARATGIITVTAGAVFEKRGEYQSQCEHEWLQQDSYCKSITQMCDKDRYVEDCIKREKENFEVFGKNVENQCKRDTLTEIRYAERRCSELGSQIEDCLKRSQEVCSHMEGIGDECRKIVTEENVRKFMEKEIKKQCKFAGFYKEKEEHIKRAEKYPKIEIKIAVPDTVTDEQIARLKQIIVGLERELSSGGLIVYSGEIDKTKFSELAQIPYVASAKQDVFIEKEDIKKPEEVAKNLIALRDIEVPKELQYLIDEKADELIDVSKDIDEIKTKEEKKGFGYKIKLFLGLAKKAEESEINELKANIAKLENSIESLAKVSEQLTDAVAKAVIIEQIDSLKEQRQDIEKLISKKEKKAKGLFGMFG